MLKEQFRSQYRDVLVHAIRAEESMSALDLSSKYDTSWDFLLKLRDQGRAQAKHWLKAHFKDIGQKSTIDIARDEMNSLAAPSIAILRAVIEDENASPALRVRTALAIIKFVTTPEKTTTPKESAHDQLLDAAYLTGYRQAQQRAAEKAEPEHEDNEIHHNSSHSSQTPRNALCPCGSGNKYKRCCGKNAPPVLGKAA